MLSQAVVVVGFICIHIFAGKLQSQQTTPHPGWLSLAGGISVAYVFLHIFPELGAAHRVVSKEWNDLPFTGYYTYLIGLVGVVIFYGLEHIAKSSARTKNNSTSVKNETKTGPGVFWIHIGSFAIYNALIGYLLVHRENQSTTELILFAVALGLHFLVNDFGLRKHHRESYQRIGRWVVAGAILLGWLIGLAWSLERAVVSTLFAFLAGSIILNVLKEELPASDESRFLPFALGAAGYSVLILLTEA